MSTHADSKPWTVPALAEAKRNGLKLVMLTAYDAGFARAFDANGVDLILIGDSLGMVVQGHDSTLPVTTDDMVYHTRAVARVLQRALLVADLPFGADATPERALDASLRLLQAGAEMVKIEGAGFKLDIIRYLVEREIPVCSHLGLTPQSVLRLGGYRVQGRGDAAQQLRDDAKAAVAAGATLIVLE
ncbi:MAG: 3-methyl-2-oxobutanoate hydroxymethyltransferase, partial [Stenotrophomonas sp.]